MPKNTGYLYRSWPCIICDTQNQGVKTLQKEKGKGGGGKTHKKLKMLILYSLLYEDHRLFQRCMTIIIIGMNNEYRLIGY